MFYISELNYFWGHKMCDTMCDLMAFKCHVRDTNQKNTQKNPTKILMD